VKVISLSNYRHSTPDLVSSIRAEKSQAPAFSHAFTGSDTVSVSFFSNRGMKSAWQADPEATDAFHAVFEAS